MKPIPLPDDTAIRMVVWDAGLSAFDQYALSWREMLNRFPGDEDCLLMISWCERVAARAKEIGRCEYRTVDWPAPSPFDNLHEIDES
jgi:hypothetical protein